MFRSRASRRGHDSLVCREAVLAATQKVCGRDDRSACLHVDLLQVRERLAMDYGILRRLSFMHSFRTLTRGDVDNSL